MKVMSFEPTPNPNAMKFNVSERLIEGGSRSFETPSAASDDVLASHLFALGKVTSVFYMPGFVTVTRTADADWSSLAPMVARTIETISLPVMAASEDTSELTGDSDRMRRVQRVLNEQILPALAGDGGGLEVVSLEGDTLTIRYQGACGSCPSSIAGTLSAIQNLLQAEVDEKLTVVAA